MGTCPSCGTRLLSTEQAGVRLGVVAGRVRTILANQPERLDAARVGWGFLVAESGLDGFERQPTGVHLPQDDNGHPATQEGNGHLVEGACPVCGEKLLSPPQAAEELAISTSWVNAILAEDPERLQAFQVGRRWYIPKSGVKHYDDERKKKRAQAQKQIAQAVQQIITARQVLRDIEEEDGGNGQGSIIVGDGETTVQVRFVFKPALCNCGAVHPKNNPQKTFPHRPGGGACQSDPMMGAAVLDCKIVN